MSSPMINNVVLLGCFFCYIFVLLLGIDSRFVDDHVFGILCNVSHGIGIWIITKYPATEYKGMFMWQTGWST